MKQKEPELHQTYFNCHTDYQSRLLRGTCGVLLNIGVLLFMDRFTPIFFWSTVLASYWLLLEGFFGCSILHWVKTRTKR